MGRFAIPPRQVVISALIAPAISLAGARLVSWLVGSAGLEPLLPVGVHTYVPLLEVVPLGTLALGSGAGLFAALILVLRAGGLSRLHNAPLRSSLGRGLLQLAILAVLGQLLLFAAQLIVVDEVQGVADGATALIMAGAVQAVVSALLAVGGLLLSLLPLALLARVQLRQAPLQPAAVSIQVQNPGGRRDFIRHPRRGPPLLPIT